MKVRLRQSLAVRLAGWILILGGVALLVLTEINRRAVERILAEQAEIQAMQSTLSVADGIDAVAGAAERLARSVARDLEGRPLTSEEIERIARNVMLDQATVFGFSIAVEPGVLGAGSDHFGRYVHRSRVASRFLARDLAAPDQAYWNRDWYREVITKGVPVWSEPFFDQGGTDRNVVRVSVPFFRHHLDGRAPAGVVSAVLDPDWLRHVANMAAFSSSSFVIIFSHSGRVISHPNPAYVASETIETIAEKDNTPELTTIHQAVLARRQGTLTYFDPIHHRSVHVNYKPTKVAGWGVIVGYDDTEFLKPQRAFRTVAAIYLAVTLLILGSIVVTVTQRALRPLGPLAESADEIAKRNLDCAIPEVNQEDEVGRLTRSFRAMRDALKAQHLERRWASQSLEHQLKYNALIIDSIGELVFVVTKGLNIVRINPAVTRMAGYTLSDVLRAPISRIVQPAVAAGEREGMLKQVLEGTGVYDQPAMILTKAGARLAARLTLVPLQDGAQVVGLVATLRIDVLPPRPSATM